MKGEAQKYPVQGDDGNVVEANEDESIIRILPGLPSGMVISAADVKHEIDNQSPSHIVLSADNSQEDDGNGVPGNQGQKTYESSHIAGLTKLYKEHLSPVRGDHPSFEQ